MARKLRIQLPGGIYLLTNRGDRREEIFRDDNDRRCFLDTLGAVCDKTGWQVHAYCLLPNHFHLVAETPKPNLVAGMKWFLGTYTARFNRRHSVTGHLFAGRYKSQVVSQEADYVRQVCDYVHLNPYRAGLLSLDQPLEGYPWSSYGSYLGVTSRPDWLRRDRLVGPDETGDHRRFAQRLERLRSENLMEENRVLRGQWCIGTPEFRREILAVLEQSAVIGSEHSGPEIQQAAEVKAARIVDEELARCVWTEAELLRKQKGDPIKIRIAQRLRAETTVTLQWIAARLHMGAKGYLSHLLYWDRRAGKAGVTAHEAKAFGKRTARRNPIDARFQGASDTNEVQDSIDESIRHPKEPIAPTEPTPHQIFIPRTDPFMFDPSFD